MTEIKKGDWVYFSDGEKETVFRCGKSNEFSIYDDGERFDRWQYRADLCHRLTPLKPGDMVERGTRCAIIETCDGLQGQIVEWHDNSYSCSPFVNCDGRIYTVERYKLARLPDCAQDKPVTVIPIEEDKLDSIPKAPKDKQVRLEVLRKPKHTQCPHPEWKPVVFGEGGYMSDEKLSPEIPCPHPEWEGVWEICPGIVYRIQWDKDRWFFFNIKQPGDWHSSKDWIGPGADNYLKIEPAPTTATAGSKLSRPQKHGGIKNPVDTW